MSFQAYLDAAEARTGCTPQQLVDLIRNGPTIPGTHVGTAGPHRDDSTLLRLDGVAARQGRRTP